jgi:hypothetical protein
MEPLHGIAAGLTKAEMLAKLRSPQNFISECESGERRVDVVELAEFARLYGKWFQEQSREYRG